MRWWPQRAKHLRVVAHLARGLDDGPRGAENLEALDPVGERLRADDRIKRGHEGHVVLHAAQRRGEAFVVGDLADCTPAEVEAAHCRGLNQARAA